MTVIFKRSEITKGLLSDTRWIATFEPGGEWTADWCTARRAAELVRAGALTPIPGKPGVFTCAAVRVNDDGTVTQLR